MEPDSFFSRIDYPIVGESLFDSVPDTVFFVKDLECRYRAVNRTLVARLGLKEKKELIGKLASDVFPSPLGEGFSAQDQGILETGAGIHGQLELHLYPNRKRGWCLTYKKPILRRDNEIVGIVGISRDVQSPGDRDEAMDSLSQIMQYIHTHLDEPLRLPQLAEMANLSVYQLNQRIRRLYHLSLGQFVTQARVDRACNRLKRSKQSIADIALECGYSDQSAFTRQFKQITGLTPQEYRRSS